MQRADISELRTEPRAYHLQRTRSAHRLSSQYLAAVLTPHIAELVPSGFFLTTNMVFVAVRTLFPGKTPVLMLIVPQSINLIVT